MKHHGRGALAGTDGIAVATWGLFALGVVCLRFLPVLPDPGMAWAIFSLAGLIVIRVHRVPGIWKPLLMFPLGLAWALIAASQVYQQRLPVALEKQDLVVIGSVQGLIRETPHGGRFDFRVREALHQGRQVAAPSLIRLSVYDRALLPSGEGTWRLTVRLKRPHGIVNPGGVFLYETWLFQARIGATGYVVALDPDRQDEDRWRTKAESAVAGLRHGFAAYLGEHASSRNAAVLSALGVGVRDGLNPDDWALMQRTGTVHLVAISGLHIGFVAVIASWISAFLWRCSPALCGWFPAPCAGALGAALAGGVYAMLAGFTLPTRRALLMLLIFVLAVLLRRSTTPARALATVLGLVLAVDPLAPMSASFWLSFVAVGVLVSMSMSVNRRPSATTLARCGMVLQGWTRTQFWLLFGMAPVLLIAFQKLSLVAPLANILVVPLVGMLVVPLTLMALLAWSVDFLMFAYWLIQGASMLLDFSWWLLVNLSMLPWAALYIAAPKPLALGSALAGLALLGLGRALPARSLGFLLLLPAFFSTTEKIPPGAFDATLLDTGQGLSVVVQTRNHVLVYDAGAAYPGGFDLGEAAVLPHLRRIAARRVDMLVASHGDNDHIGGTGSISRELPVDRFITSVPDSERAPAGGEFCHWDQSWEWDGVGFRVLWPPPGRPYRGNNSSCVIVVESRAGSILLAGDIESAVERALLRHYGSRLKSDVLLVPHHGSKTSSTSGFLRQVDPRIGLVSSGYRNRFGHPHAAVIARYQRYGIPVVNTASEGAVSLRFRAAGITASGARDHLSRFWLEPGKHDFGRLNAGVLAPGLRVIESLATPSGQSYP